MYEYCPARRDIPLWTLNNGFFYYISVAISFLSSNDRFSMERMMALVGYMGNACNLLVCPYVIEFCITHALHGMTGRPNTIVKDILFIVFGLLLTVCGTFAIIVRIFRDKDCYGDYCKLD